MWLHVLPDPLGPTDVDAPDSRPAAFDLAHADDVVATCGERTGRWSFTYLQAGQQVTATVEIGPDSSAEDVQAILAVLDSVTLEDRRPADQRALVALQLEQAHDTMTQATWGGGGIQSWGASRGTAGYRPGRRPALGRQHAARRAPTAPRRRGRGPQRT